MTSPRDGRKKWRCRAATRYGWSGDLAASGAGKRYGEGDSSGFLARWARRHVERCVDCRAEAAEWERIVLLLRQTDRPAAPAGLLDRVMAGIAQERAAEAEKVQRTSTAHVGEAAKGEEGEKGTRAAGRNAAAKRLWSQDDLWVREGLLGLAFYLATAMGGLGGAALILPQSLGLLDRAVALALVTGAWWRAVVVDVLAVVERASYAFPEGLQPYADALWWSVSGMLLAATILRVTQRIKIVTSD